ELDPVQSESVVNASKVGSLSLSLRSIADFDEEATAAVRRSSSQSVRVIKFGNEQSVTTGSITPPTAAPVVVDPGAYAPPVGADAATQPPSTAGGVPQRAPLGQ